MDKNPFYGYLSFEKTEKKEARKVFKKNKNFERISGISKKSRNFS